MGQALNQSWVRATVGQVADNIHAGYFTRDYWSRVVAWGVVPPEQDANYVHPGVPYRFEAPEKAVVPEAFA